MTRASRHAEKPSVALIGFRGCGKSTVGRELSATLGWELVDTDDIIMAQACKSIARIFAEEGEPAFRDRERAVIQSLPAQPPKVICVGGGAMLDERNTIALRTIARIVWLSAPSTLLWNRINSDPTTAHTRPPLTSLSGLAEVEQLLARRTPIYERAADMTVPIFGKSPGEIAREIAESLTTLA